MASSGSNLDISSKPALYQQLCTQLGDIIGSEHNLVANAANAAALLFHSMPDVNWAGFYFTAGEELVLGPFQGKTACTRIPFGKGVCGTAAAEKKTITVPDVNKFPGHIVCDSASKSEIVVPLLNWGRLVGVLDVDSPTIDRFDEDDKEGLESIAAVLLAGASEDDDLPDFSEEAALG